MKGAVRDGTRDVNRKRHIKVEIQREVETERGRSSPALEWETETQKMR